MAWSARITGIAAVFGFCLACAGGPGGEAASVPDEQRFAFDAAVARQQSAPAAGRAAFEAFLTRFPGSPLADEAALRLAEQALAGGRQDEGVRWLGVVLTRYPTSNGEPLARLRLAQLEYARDRKVAARGLLEPVDSARLPSEARLDALDLQVALAQTPVDRMRQLARLDHALRAARAPSGASALAQLSARRQAATRDIAALASAAAPAELEAMFETLERGAARAAIAEEIAERAVKSGDTATAEAALDRAERSAEDDARRERIAQLRARFEHRPVVAALAPSAGEASAPAELAPLRELSEYTRADTRGASGTLGVVLPLSGDFAEFGEASLRGVLLAAGVFRSPELASSDALDPLASGDGLQRRDDVGRDAGLDVRVVVRDSGGDPARAAEAVRELAERDDVVAVVGPIFSDEALASAQAAEEAGVPLVTLSNREDVTAGRRFVLRTRTTPADEVGVLVDHAIGTLSAKRFGVLYPKTRYGRGMRKLFADAVEARGGELVALASYSPGETDFSTVIREMLGYRFLSALERQAIAERDRAVEAARSLPPAQAARARKEAFERTAPDGSPLPPIVDFDVLFIPDSADAVAMIAPGLALQGVRDVRLLGSSDWIDASLLRGADRHISGAVVSTPFYAASDVGVVREFVADFQAVFAASPDAYAAQGYDAANLVLQQLASRRRDRASLRDGLLAVRAFPGVSGPLTMQPDGNARRRPFLLEVAGQRFVPLD